MGNLQADAVVQGERELMYVITEDWTGISPNKAMGREERGEDDAGAATSTNNIQARQEGII